MEYYYVVIAFIQTNYITALVEATNANEAKWKGLLAITKQGYDTSKVEHPLIYKIDVNEVEFNPSKREETSPSPIRRNVNE